MSEALTVMYLAFAVAAGIVAGTGAAEARSRGVSWSKVIVGWVVFGVVMFLLAVGAARIGGAV